MFGNLKVSAATYLLSPVPYSLFPVPCFPARGGSPPATVQCLLLFFRFRRDQNPARRVSPDGIGVRTRPPQGDFGPDATQSGKWAPQPLFPVSCFLPAVCHVWKPEGFRCNLSPISYLLFPVPYLLFPVCCLLSAMFGNLKVSATTYLLPPICCLLFPVPSLLLAGCWLA